jgi:3-isopropylmalate/(R)-2-methylmalate dehydratase small subunit
MSSFSNSLQIASVSGRGIPIQGDNIDTDQILPARYLKTVTFQGIEAHVFADCRTAAKRAGQAHPFDDPRYTGGSLLLVNRNFGCGSSREHAPQGLRRFGISAIIGESFGEIFAGNCVSVGMPCVQVTTDVVTIVQNLTQSSPATRFTLDLESLTLSADRHRFSINLVEGRRRQFIEGTWDPTAVLLRAADAIERTLMQLNPTMDIQPHQ